ncbi:hypothetical protein AYO40_00100 [Planctomycetaceae bacterium SCGC AG-212-D15]|nr:hypothetical protein AYO40_00100 [Planctomycetaceae bacterium SCGC AG-212-D15]
MKRLALSLPVLLVGLPLLGCLILAHTRNADRKEVAPKAAPEPSIVVEVPKKGKLPKNAEMVELIKTQPAVFLEKCLAKYPRVVKTGYSLTLWKQEVLEGTEYKPELIEVVFRQDPHSVYFHWLEGARKAERVIYVEGENKDRAGKSEMIVQPNGAFLRRFIVTRPVDGADARASGHYPLNDFGFQKNETRTYTAWKKNFATGHEKVEYVGTEKVKELNDRECWVVRSSTDTPEADGVCELTSYWDTEWWLQTGSILKDKDGKEIGRYWFRDIKLNPEINANQFTRETMK